MLTHDKVRAILARLERDGQPDGCDHDCDERCDECSPLHDTQALCDEWIAARTVRWQGSALVSAAEPLALGHTEDADLGRTRGVFYRYGLKTTSSFDTAAEARAWLEERAREAGFEVAR